MAEAPGETWAETEEKITMILKEKLQLQHKVEVKRAQRVGKPREGDKPRPVVIKLLRYKDRDAILQCAKSLKGTRISSMKTTQTLSEGKGKN